MKKIIYFLFATLFFLVPLVLWPYTSELFEFNKMVVTYLLTILIVSTWGIRMISERKFIFRRTILDTPLLIFLASQLISTLLSIDATTSWFGYYSRFNGGLLSTISYLLLYWAFVSNIDKENAKKIINVTLWSATIVAIYGVLEHLGIDKKIWQQDVQSRVFSTLGQPNWLAAWLIALIPITWAKIVDRNDAKTNFKNILPYFFSTLYFTVLLFTGSRSGLLGFGVIEIVFWSITFLKYRSKVINKFLLSNIPIVLIAIIFGTQYTPSIFKLIEKTQTKEVTVSAQTGSTALETGGTESGTIRKIVWQGAIQVWKHYPIFGTGVETFAYSYYLYRPAAHNLTSEWDYIYNKAHNEYLNLLANTGSVGILAYFGLIIFVIIGITNIKFPTKNLKANSSWLTENDNLSIAFLSGYLSILITNFFGFSVVPIQLLFYLFPAFSVALIHTDTVEKEHKLSLSPNQKLASWLVIAITGYLVFVTCKYWYTDYLYATAYNYNRANRYDLSPKLLAQVIKLEPNQAIYYSELAKSYTNLALAYNEAKESTAASQLTEAAIENVIKAVNISPANVNLKRLESGIFIMLSGIDPNYLLDARDVLVSAILQAPTDAKLHYNLGLIYSRIGEKDLALQTLKETVDMKANYKDARLAYAILLINAGNKSEAKEQLEYILTNIDPTDSISKQYLDGI